MTTSPLRLGISRCLLGDEVRFDGGHKHDHFLTDVLGRYVECVPVCPEMEAGLDTPREAMRLVGNPHRPRLMTITSKHDHTQALETMIEERLDSLHKLGLSGICFQERLAQLQGRTGACVPRTGHAEPQQRWNLRESLYRAVSVDSRRGGRAAL